MTRLIPTSHPLTRRVLLGGLTTAAAIATVPAAGQTGGDLLAANTATVRRLIEGVQRDGDFALFERLFAHDYVDHTPFGDFTPDRNGTRQVYQGFRTAFPDWHAVIHDQIAERDLVTTRKTYRGTHRGLFMGIAPSGRATSFDVIDILQIRDGQIVAHWGFGDGAGLLRQIS
jgi:steroid delta-isomerase-like uncharacterized protein